MVKTVTTRAKHAIADVAQRSVDGVRSITGEAFDAAAKAGEVVLESTTSALEAGRATIKKSTPAVKRAIGIVARRKANKPARGKAVPKRKTVAKKKKKARSRN